MQENSSIKKVKLSIVGKEGKMGKMVSALAKNDPDLELSDDADVVIDFSSPEGTKKAISMGRPLVCGTTGLTEEIFDQMHTLSKQVPVLYSPNFSLGIALLFEMMEAYSDKLKRYGKIFIEETHHTEKLDSPSGTALKLGKILEAESISSKREGRVVGIHQVKISFDDEMLSIAHEAYSRKAFANGALVCAKMIVGRSPKMYRLSEVFD